MCEHEHTSWSDEDEGVLYCQDCGRAIQFICDACHGEGFVDSAEFNADWVNYAEDEFEICPICQGDGVIDIVNAS